MEDLGDSYDQDLSLPLQTNGPFRFELEPNDDGADIKENAIVDVTFRGQIIQIQSSDSGATGTKHGTAPGVLGSWTLVRDSKKV